jgi:hypothetical protein
MRFSSADVLGATPPESDSRAEPDLEQEPKVVSPKAGPAPTSPTQSGKPDEPSQNRVSKVNRPNVDRINANRQASVKPSLPPVQAQKPVAAPATAVLFSLAAPRPNVGGGMLLLRRFRDCFRDYIRDCGVPAIWIGVMVWFFLVARRHPGPRAADLRHPFGHRFGR